MCSRKNPYKNLNKNGIPKNRSQETMADLDTAHNTSKNGIKQNATFMSLEDLWASDDTDNVKTEVSVEALPKFQKRVDLSEVAVLAEKEQTKFTKHPNDNGGQYFKRDKKKYVKNDNRDASKGSDAYAFDLQGKRILLLGGKSFTSQCSASIQQYNGLFDYYDAHPINTAILEAKIAKADVVLFVLEQISHQLSWDGHDLAKKHHVPFEEFRGYGTGIVFRSIKKALTDYADAHSDEITQ
ncbi:DUF2325 domain-containing protein [Periweissella cryptocerci]|uniref:DUF2325 domain-containing protein n=1 Tax=Periweissella cryptocerci TaxID=2506420 RepID=A0A4V1AIB7_9LACO|nr:DUF2325 domain-containing protein [Periweissella cryptocerci]QBO34945.1 DUF2325 domain-containing protein [Periweissella cryptocerci]